MYDARGHNGTAHGVPQAESAGYFSLTDSRNRWKSAVISGLGLLIDNMARMAAVCLQSGVRHEAESDCTLAS